MTHDCICRITVNYVLYTYSTSFILSVSRCRWSALRLQPFLTDQAVCLLIGHSWRAPGAELVRWRLEHPGTMILKGKLKHCQNMPQPLFVWHGWFITMSLLSIYNSSASNAKVLFWRFETNQFCCTICITLSLWESNGQGTGWRRTCKDKWC